MQLSCHPDTNCQRPARDAHRGIAASAGVGLHALIRGTAPENESLLVRPRAPPQLRAPVAGATDRRRGPTDSGSRAGLLPGAEGTGPPLFAPERSVPPVKRRRCARRQHGEVGTVGPLKRPRTGEAQPPLPNRYTVAPFSRTGEAGAGKRRAPFCRPAARKGEKRLCEGGRPIGHGRLPNWVNVAV